MDNLGWSQVQISNFRQDVHPLTLSDGTVHEPTLDWIALVTAKRGDGIKFVVEVRVTDDDFRKTGNTVGFMIAHIQNSLEMLESFRTCGCKVDSVCEFHSKH